MLTGGAGGGSQRFKGVDSARGSSPLLLEITISTTQSKPETVPIVSDSEAAFYRSVFDLRTSSSVFSTAFRQMNCARQMFAEPSSRPEHVLGRFRQSGHTGDIL